MTEKDMSFRKVAEQGGGTISHSTVAEIANGQRNDVRRDTLIALAKGLRVPEADVFRAARGLSTDAGDRFDIYAERFDAHELSKSEWQFLETMFKDQVDRFRYEKEEYKRRAIADGERPAPVVARIEPGKPDATREDIAKNLRAASDAIKKRKAG